MLDAVHNLFGDENVANDTKSSKYVHMEGTQNAHELGRMSVKLAKLLGLSSCKCTVYYWHVFPLLSPCTDDVLLLRVERVRRAQPSV